MLLSLVVIWRVYSIYGVQCGLQVAVCAIKKKIDQFIGCALVASFDLKEKVEELEE